jgi:hypothetical protein
MFRLACALVGSACLLGTVTVAREQDRPGAPVPGLLAAAGAYLDRFAHDISAVVIEEDYTQEVRERGSVTTRHLQSDLMVVGDVEDGLIQLRDVFEVDGKPVRDRDNRLARLLGGRTRDLLTQGRRIAAESARYNINPGIVAVNRTLNLPMAALGFLRTVNQRRSRFELAGARTIDGRTGQIVHFVETGVPRLIGSHAGAPAEGAFAIDPATGAVLASDLIVVDGGGGSFVRASFHVVYTPDPATAFWVPASMTEAYDVRNGQNLPVASITGRAAYSNVRRFNVAVEEKAREPDQQ